MATCYPTFRNPMHSGKVSIVLPILMTVIICGIIAIFLLYTDTVEEFKRFAVMDHPPKEKTA